ncbi:MAG: YqgE/AlgH family protein [Acidobacteria bacterium]|nr:YqgE/AlgH family protein [Acidobacteriota bacterium]
MDYSAPCILVASPLLLDPNFLHTVVLVIEHDENGAFGIILNRPLPVTLAHICEESGSEYRGPEEATAWRGGPVDPQRGVLVVQGGLPGDEDTVLDFTHFVSHRKDLLEELLQDPKARYRLFLGYAGWGPGQLDGEMDQKAWVRLPLHPEWLMHPDPRGLWEVAVQSGEA